MFISTKVLSLQIPFK